LRTKPYPLLIDVNSLLQSQELVEEIKEQVELSLNMSRRIPKQRVLNGVGFFLVKVEQFFGVAYGISPTNYVILIFSWIVV